MLIFASCNNINNNCLKELGAYVSRLSDINTIKLSFMGCPIGDEGVSELTVSLNKLKNLTHFSLNLSKYNLDLFE